MPVMDGYKATERIRALGQQIPIIALTASWPKEMEHHAYQAGVGGVVVKPLHPNELYPQ
jgi:CheY-like chemotaxis protein